MRQKGIALSLIASVALAACGGEGAEASAPAVTAPPPAVAGDAEWQLVWSDEFNGTELDRTKWTPEQSCWGGGNNERQCYTDRPENIAVEDGMLLLKARKEDFTGPDRPPEIAASPNPQVSREYTSGKVRTIGLHAWKYGRIEARAKVPAGQGMWPAIWMMPQDNFYGGWPLSGEIDILETVNIGAGCDECEGTVGENRTVSALHFGNSPPDNRVLDQKTPLPSLALPSKDFHVYAVEWGEGLIRFFVDDRLHFEVTADKWFSGSSKAQGNPNAPFDKPFYLMANLAVGGKWPEETNDKGLAESSLPNQFALDWIRVYQCDTDPDTGRACMK